MLRGVSFFIYPVSAANHCPRVVRILYQAIILFHDILCNGNTPGTERLSSVLYELPKSRHEVWSSSLAHYYVVAIGRLSYAPVPQWLNRSCKEMIEASCGQLLSFDSNLIASLLSFLRSGTRATGISDRRPRGRPNLVRIPREHRSNGAGHAGRY